MYIPDELAVNLYYRLDAYGRLLEDLERFLKAESIAEHIMVDHRRELQRQGYTLERYCKYLNEQGILT